MTSQYHPKPHLKLSSRPFSVWIGTLCTSRERNQINFTSRTFLTMMYIILETILDINPTQDYYCLPHPKPQTSYETSRFRTIARINILCHLCSYNVFEMRHNLCWNVQSTTPFEIGFFTCFKVQYQGISSLSSNWTPSWYKPFRQRIRAPC